MTTCSKSSPKSSQQPPTNDDLTTNPGGEGSSGSNPNPPNSGQIEPDHEALHHQQELETTQQEEAECAAESLCLATLSDGSNPSSNSQARQEPAGQFNPLLDFDDLLAEDMDIDKDPDVLIQKLQILIEEKDVAIKVANNQSSQIQVKIEEKIKAESNLFTHQNLIECKTAAMQKYNATIAQLHQEIDMAKSTLHGLQPNEPVTLASTAPAPDMVNALNMLPDLNCPKHHSLACWGGFKTIPVFASTNKIDFS